MMACGPCVVSIFEHHREQPCHIYVITKSLPQVDVEGLEQIAARYGGRLTVKTIHPEILQGLKVSDRFRESIYYRFLLPDLFPDEEKMLYMDCDIRCRNFGGRTLKAMRARWWRIRRLMTLLCKTGLECMVRLILTRGYCWSIWTIGGSIMWHVGWWSSSGNIRRSAFFRIRML